MQATAVVDIAMNVLIIMDTSPLTISGNSKEVNISMPLTTCRQCTSPSVAQAWSWMSVLSAIEDNAIVKGCTTVHKGYKQSPLQEWRIQDDSCPQRCTWVQFDYCFWIRNKWIKAASDIYKADVVLNTNASPLHSLNGVWPHCHASMSIKCKLQNCNEPASLKKQDLRHTWGWCWDLPYLLSCWKLQSDMCRDCRQCRNQ